MSGKLKTSVKLFLEKLNEIGFKDSLELRRDLDRNVKVCIIVLRNCFQSLNN